MPAFSRSLAFALLACTVASPAIADVRAGVEAWSRGDYAAAIKEWRPLAINGDADAQFNMGQAYKLGRSVPVDLLIAEDWYRKASLQGHIQAEDNYGLVLFQNGNREKAMPIIQKSAERGEPRAQYVYGTALFNGDMVKKDWPLAYAFMTRASASGLAPASASLAQMDKFVPVDQRQRGLAMARDLETQAQRPMLAEALQNPASRPSARPSPPIRRTEVPPSISPGVEFEAASAPPESLPKRPPRAMIERVAPTPPKPVPAAAPKPAMVAATPGGKWRIQLGAFSEDGKARALWKSLEGRIDALGSMQPFLVKAGPITRLQAGPLANKAAAEKLCASVRASGNPCLTVGG